MGSPAATSSLRQILEGQLSQLSNEVERLFDEAHGRARRELSDRLNQSVRRLRQAGSLEQLAATLLDAAATFAAGVAIFRVAGPAAQGQNIRGVPQEAAQGFGASYNNRRLGTFGHATATSFFPAKPLGCYGDGGAVMTDDDALADAMRSLRVHGQGSDKYDNVRIGLASRLDTIQAAVLSEKLKIFPDEIEARNVVARRYAEGLGDVVTVPSVPAGNVSVWAQYTLRLPAGKRDAFAAALKADGIPTAIYYPIPLHRQQAYKSYPVSLSGVAVSETLAAEVISLPMHAYLDEPTQGRIIDAVRRAVKA